MLTNPVAEMIVDGSVLPDGDWRTIRRSPLFCGTCLNLFPASAYSLVPRKDIFDVTISKRIHGVDSNAPKDGRVWQFGARAVDVKSRAHEGCKSCELLMMGVQLMTEEQACGDRPWFEDDCIVLNVVFCEYWVLRVRVLRLEAEDEPEEDDDDMGGMFGDTDDNLVTGETLDWFEVYTLPGAPCPWPTVGSSMHTQDPQTGGDYSAWAGGQVSHVSFDSTSENAFHSIRQKVNDCVKDHDECGCEDSMRGVLPRRLLEVGTCDDDIRLVEFADDLVNKQHVDMTYTALSHCWGQSQHMTTGTATLEDRQRNISWADLPKTFQDAIVVTRLLGVRYLWIDSLCILQDSKSDWEHEAAKMGSIYNEAHVVITATSSTDGDGGCFFPRQSYGTIKGTSSDPTTDSQEWEVFIRRSKNHSAFGWETIHPQTSQTLGLVDAYLQDYTQYPLFKRAWCFQERMLGRRILHFTATEMVFECLTSVECECGAMSAFLEAPMLEPRHLLHSLTRLTEDYDRFERWRMIATEYSRKNITYATDLLPALAGLASKWAGLINQRYLAGLWQDDLKRGLLWKADEPDPGNENTYVAPTWSWLSVRSSVTWIKETTSAKYYFDIDLSRTECVQKGFHFGELTNGWTFLTASLVRATLTAVDWVRVQSIMEPYGLGKPQKFRADRLNRCNYHIDKDVWVMPYCTDVTNETTGDGFNSALVLVPAGKAARDFQSDILQQWSGGIYERLGVIQYYEKWEWDTERIWDPTRVPPTSFYFV